MRVTESVWAAVAYATDAKDSGSLIRWCFDNGIPLKFWGRLDEEVPVRIEILNLFLNRQSPEFVCKLVKHHHAKVIWWRGFGVYIGSANLTYSAWNSFMDATTLRGAGLSHLLRQGEHAVDMQTLVEREISRLER